MKNLKNILALAVVFTGGLFAGMSNENNAKAEQEKEVQKVIEYVEVFVEVEKEVPVEIVKEVEVIKEVEVPVEVEVVKEVEIVKEIEAVHEAGAVQEIEQETQETKEVKTVQNEDTIYNMFDVGDEIYIMPLKATVFEFDGKDYTVLSDGYGSLYIEDFALKDGQNYVGKVDGINDELIEYKESDFEFTYQDYFDEYKNEEIAWAIEEMEKTKENIDNLIEELFKEDENL